MRWDVVGAKLSYLHLSLLKSANKNT